MLAKLRPGKVLCAVHFLDTGAADVEAIYFVHVVRPDADGALVNATSLGTSGKAHADYRNVHDGSDHVLHLCRSTHHFKGG